MCYNYNCVTFITIIIVLHSLQLQMCYNCNCVTLITITNVLQLFGSKVMRKAYVFMRKLHNKVDPMS